MIDRERFTPDHEQVNSPETPAERTPDAAKEDEGAAGSPRDAGQSPSGLTKTRRLDHDLVPKLLDLAARIFSASYSENSFSSILNDTVSLLGQYTRSDRVFLYSLDEQEHQLRLTHIWPDEPFLGESPVLISLDNFPGIEQELGVSGEIIIADASHLSQEWAAERQLLESLDIKSLCTVPIKGSGRLFGVLGFDSIGSMEDWNADELTMLRFFAENIGAAWQRMEKESELQKALTLAEKMNGDLRRINGELVGFLSRMSHEIRTALNSIMGLSRMLQQSNLEIQPHKHARNIESAGSLLLDISKDILDYSRLEQGKTEFRTSIFSLNSLITACVEAFQKQAADKGLSILVNVSPVIPEDLTGDSLHIGQILSNMIGNAVRYTESGTISITGLAAAGGPDSLRLFVIVEDTGPGIPAEAIERIFDPFFQAAGSTSSRVGSTGLGLAICRQLTARLGGRLGVRSSIGSGTAFFVEIPVVSYHSGRGVPDDLPPIPSDTYFAVDCTTSGLLSSSLTSSGRNVRSPGGVAGKQPESRLIPAADARILAVDDIRINLEVLLSQINLIGLSADAVMTGEAALDHLENHSCDLLLLDIGLPGIDGFEVCRRIRASSDPVIAAIPVIAFTAYAHESIEEESRKAGIDAFITKPIDYDILVRTLSRYIDLASAAVQKTGGKTTFQKGRQHLPADPHLTESAAAGSERRRHFSASSGDELPILDIDALLQRVGDDRKLAGKILRDFYHGFSSIIDQVGQTWKNRQRGVIVRQVHAVKSAAANLGAVRLHLAGDRLEKLLLDSGDPVGPGLQAAVEQFCDEHAAVVAMIRNSELFDQPRDSRRRRPISRSALLDRLQNAQHGLRLGEIQQIDDLREVVEHADLPEPVSESEMAAFLQELDRYDFEAALKIGAVMIDKLRSS